MQRFGSRMTSSDDDIDPELKEGIKNIMKLRDEYDKLEGALRKLGVDSGALQVAMERNNELSTHMDSSGQETMNSQNEQIFCLPTIMASPLSNCSSASDSHGRGENSAQRGYEKYREMSLDYNKMMESAESANKRSDNMQQHLMENNSTIVSSLSGGSNGGESLTFDSNNESERNRPNDFMGIRSKRHLDIVEEVDESLISTSENGEDPISSSYQAVVQLPQGTSTAETAQAGQSSYSWVQMALPGGGIVSVPLECASVASSSSATGAMNNEDTRGSGNHYHYGSGGSSQHAGATSNGNSGQSDVLTVAAGEPVTHFNLDQLLEIVQSFQLDTTMAGHIPDSGHSNIPQNLAGRSAQFLEMGGAQGGSCDGKECDTILLSPQSGDRVGKSSLSGAGNGTSTSRVKKYNVNKQNGASNSVIGGSSGISSYARDDTDVVIASSDGGASGNAGRETHSCPSSPTETDCSSGFSTLRKRSVTVTEKIRTNRDGSKTQVVRQYGCNTSSANDPNQNVSYKQDSYVYINGPSNQGEDGELPPPPPTIPEEDNISCSTQRSGITGHEIGFTDTMSTGGGSISRANNIDSSRNHSTSLFSNNIMSTTSNSLDGNRMSGSIIGNSQHLNSSSGSRNNQDQHNRNFRGHIVRLNSIEPNTVMFNTKDYPILVDVTVPEIIDELEKQFDDKLCDLQGVRLVGSNVYICLSRKESLEHLSTYGFYVRGVPVKLVDITAESVVVCLTGVPHYITDATVTMLVSTFGIAIGEVERRFYKGVDTGERFIRLKPRPHIQVPDFVTVGGCKILIRILSQEETATPFTLQNSKSSVSVKGDGASGGAASLLECIAPFSSASQPQQNMMLATEADLLQLSPPSSLGGGLGGMLGTSSNTFNSGIGNSSSSVLFGGGVTNGGGGPTFRAKPGHCNGTINSTGISNSGEMSFSNIPTSFMHLPVSSHNTSISSAQIPPISSSQVSYSANNVLSDGNDSDHVPPMLLSITSPKIRKSFGSRIQNQMGRGSPPTKTMSGMPGDGRMEMEHTTYLPGDTVDGIPTLSPPPYKSSSTTGSNSSVTGHDTRESDRGKITSYSVIKRGAGGFESSSLNQRLTQSEKQMMSPTEGLITLPKSGNSILQAKHSSSITNRTNSSTSMGSIGGSRPGGGINSISTMDREIGSLTHHRQMVGTIGGSKVIFEESSDQPNTSANNTNNKMSSSTTGSVPIASPSAPQPRGTGGKGSVANSKAVNGILRKGSIPGNEIVSPPMETKESSDRKSSGDKDRDGTSKRSRKNRDGDKGDRSNHKSKSKSKSNSGKLGSLKETNDGDKAQETDGEKSRGGGSRSRSNSTKSSSKAEKQQEKIQKDLALTRDLPWCGCWGNGCL